MLHLDHMVHVFYNYNYYNTVYTCTYNYTNVHVHVYVLYRSRWWYARLWHGPRKYDVSCILSSKIDVELNLGNLTFMCIIIYYMYMYMYIHCGCHGYEVSHYSIRY